MNRKSGGQPGNSNRRSYTVSQLKEAVEKTLCKLQAQKYLAKTVGSNSPVDRKGITRLIEEYNIDTSHWLSVSELGKLRGRSIQDYLENKFPIASSELREKVLREGYLENKCYICGLGDTWMGKPISLQLHHIDGNCNDNSLENLQILCPNCHTQTDNYGSRNTGNNHERKEYRKKYREEKKNGRN